MSTNNHTIKAACSLTCKTLDNGARNLTPVAHTKGIGLAKQPEKTIQEKKQRVETKNTKNVKDKKKAKETNLKKKSLYQKMSAERKNIYPLIYR